jgi:3-dehydroquinate dehydratase-2
VKSVWVLQGPNLNLLGMREPERYGRVTLAEVQAGLDAIAPSLGASLTHHQDNSEGGLVDCVHRAWRAGAHGVVINPGAYTHTSVALRDALLGTALPFVEIHVSNVFARESFRHHSYLSDVAVGVIVGCGTVGYELALRALLARLGPA